MEGEGKASEVQVATLTTKAEMAEKLLEQPAAVVSALSARARQRVVERFCPALEEERLRGLLQRLGTERTSA